MPVCSNNCKYYDLIINNIPMLYRTTITLCPNPNCGKTTVSLYEHKFCIFCAPEGTDDYKYHHNKCIKPSTNLNVNAKPFFPNSYVDEPCLSIYYNVKTNQKIIFNYGINNKQKDYLINC